MRIIILILMHRRTQSYCIMIRIMYNNSSITPMFHMRMQ